MNDSDLLFGSEDMHLMDKWNGDLAEAFVKERNVALEKLAVSWAMDILPDKNPAELLILLHQTRYEVATMPDELRILSRDFLISKGLSRLYGDPFPADGKLERV